MNPSLNKWIARILVLSMANPALFVPSAMAKDTDVYSGFLAESSTTIKPNILFLLDTSDSMNLPEAWKEYPGAYDSHVEYLWNDLGIIVDADVGSPGENTVAKANTYMLTSISTEAVPTNPNDYASKYGYWSGASPEARQALWQAARSSANATQTNGGVVDPGPASQYRNYNDLSWIYWLPAGAGENDARLRSPSWNRFRGYIQELGNGSNGTIDGGGMVRGLYFKDTNDFRSFNQCGVSLSELTPSTVFVPSSVARNSGKYTGQQWARWEPYLNLTAVGNAGYPGSSTLAPALGGSNQYPGGYLDTSNVASGSPTNNLVFRDSYPLSDPIGATPTNVGSQGLPIRYDGGNAGAGWDQLKADVGGFTLASTIANYSNQADLEQVMSWYGLPATTNVDGSGASDINDTKFIAAKGNRDASPAFGAMTGISAYRDATPASCDSATGPADTTHFSCMDKPGGTPIGAFTLTKTAVCNLTGNSTETDANSDTKKIGGACTIGAITPGGSDLNGAAVPNNADVPDPTACPGPTINNGNVRTAKYGSRINPLQTLVAATSCPVIGQRSVVIGGCSVSGGSNVTIDQCALIGTSTVTVDACQWSGRADTTIGRCTWSGRTATKPEGHGWIASGGTCQESGAGTTYCQGVSDSTEYATQALAVAASASCTNKVAEGSYKSGGTCTENGSASSCKITGGTTVAGLPGLYNQECGNAVTAKTYTVGGTECQEHASNLSCNAPTAGTDLSIRGTTYKINKTCTNKGNAPPVFNAANTTKTYNQDCAASQNNNTCTSGPGTAFTIRGDSYTPKTCLPTLAAGTYYEGGSCGASPCAVGTDYSSTGSITYNDGTYNGTWYKNAMTCTGATSALTRRTDCTGRITSLPAYPPGGPGQTAGTSSPTRDATNLTVPVAANTVPVATPISCSAGSTTAAHASARTCTYTTSAITPPTVTASIPAGVVPPATPISCSSGSTTASSAVVRTCTYSNYATCTLKSDVNVTCQARYGSSDFAVPANTIPAPTPTSCTAGSTTAAWPSARTCTYSACSTGCAAATPTSVSFPGSSQTHNFYRTYNFKESTDYLVHDCKADDASANNPGGNSFMRNIPGSLAPVGTAFNSGLSSSLLSNAAAYSSTSAQSVSTDVNKKSDMYSVNYLNWKFGPKGPTGDPIGRKSRLQIAKDVLSDVIGTINGVRIGIMAFNQEQKDQVDGAFTSPGAHLASAIKDLDETTRPALIASANALIASSATPMTESLYESYRYFRGQTPVFGGGNLTGTNYDTFEARGSAPGNLHYVTEGRDTSADAIVSGAYKSPITQTCQSNLVILVSDGGPENDWSANALINSLPDAGAVSIDQGTTSNQFEVGATGLPYGPPDTGKNAPESPGNYVLLDELSNYMAHVDARADLAGDQSVQLSTVGFGVKAPILENAAQVGGGNYYEASSATDLKDALVAAIKSVTQWQPQGSMPALSFNQVTGKSDDVYLAAFSPSSNISWPGTVKKFKFGYGEADCGNASCSNPLICLTGNAAVTYGTCGRNVEQVVFDPTLGLHLRKVRQDAVSFWIPSTTPDSASGSKGGTGQILVSNGSPDARNLYTYLGNTSDLADETNAIKDSNALITKSLLGDADMSNARRNQLIGFAQGSDGMATSTWRSWPHYDSVHSAPIVDDITGTTLYYLTSDGVLHAVNTSNGIERWSFMVPEGLPRIADFQANLVGSHLEVADGNLVQVTTVDARHLLVFGMRRGGRGYYALDITDPSAPLFAWKITDSTTGYSSLGQAWSTPQVGLVRGQKSGSTLKPVLIFGGGYDVNQDGVSPGADLVGSSVFVADAATGALIHEFVANQSYSIPADVLAIDATGDAAGTIDRAYVGDMGGNLWRMDLDDGTAANPPANWSIVRLAKLSTTTRRNKLFNKVTAAAATFDGQRFDAVFVGGGDMQRPSAKTVNDSGAFFMVKDFTVAGVATQKSPVPDAESSAAPQAPATLEEAAIPFTNDFVDMSSVMEGDLIKRSGDSELNTKTKKFNIDALKAAKGYVINLTEGRKVTSYATVINGQAFFGIYFPRQDDADEGSTQCILGGYGEQWGLNALSGTTLRDAAGNSIYAGGHIMGYNAGPGVGLNLVTSGKGIFLWGSNWEPTEPADPTGYKTVDITANRVFWYSVPEQQ